MKITFHRNHEKTQSDYSGGAIDIKTVDPKEAFELGMLFERVYRDGNNAVYGEWGQGVFIRFPLISLEK